MNNSCMKEPSSILNELNTKINSNLELVNESALNQLIALANKKKLKSSKKSKTSYLSSIFSSASASHLSSVNSLSSNSCATMLNSNNEQSRRVQPRTNPNYVNVNLIDANDGSLVKNKYVKYQELKEDGNKQQQQQPIAKKYMVHKAKTEDLKRYSNSSSDIMTQVTYLMLLLLDGKSATDITPMEKLRKSISNSSSNSASINTLCSNRNSLSRQESESQMDMTNDLLMLNREKRIKKLRQQFGEGLEVSTPISGAPSSIAQQFNNSSNNFDSIQSMQSSTISNTDIIAGSFSLTRKNTDKKKHSTVFSS